MAPLLLTLPEPQSNTSAICANDFPDRSAEAFGLYRSFQAAVSCALFFVTPTFSADGEHPACLHLISRSFCVLLPDAAERVPL